MTGQQKLDLRSHRVSEVEEEEEEAVDWEGAEGEECVRDLPLPLLTLMGKWYIYALETVERKSERERARENVFETCVYR